MLEPTKTETGQTAAKVLQVPFLNLKKLMAPQWAEYVEAFERVSEKTQFIGGDELRIFERNFASWIGEEMSAVGCANGTDAIRLAALALRLPPNSEAIVPAMTYFATAEALCEAGLKVKLVDVADLDSM